MYELDSGWPYNYWIPIFIPLTHENKVDILLCISQLYSIVKVVHLAKVIYIFHIILPDYSHILIGGNFYFEITCWLTLMFSMYECTLCIHVNKNCIGRRFLFCSFFQGVHKASLLILKEQQSRILHVKDLSPLVFQLHLPHPQLIQVKHLSGFIRNPNNSWMKTVNQLSLFCDLLKTN